MTATRHLQLLALTALLPILPSPAAAVPDVERAAVDVVPPTVTDEAVLPPVARPVVEDAEPPPEALAPPEDGRAEDGAAEPEEAPVEVVPFVQLLAVAEYGFLAPLAHTIQFGKTGSVLDYVAEGGQDNLFAFGRVSAEMNIDRGHTVVFLYQPLEARTSAVLARDLTIDGLVFPEGTPVDFRYGFDFWRLGYHYNFFGDQPGMELSLGLGLQIRNAAIEFTSADGALRRTNHDIGPVPLIKLRGRYTWDVGVWLGVEVDGFWAPIKYLNGKGSDVEGAIIDLSARVGYNVWGPLDMFLNVRYLGGGAEGTGSADGPGSDGWVANWLHFLTVSLGAEVRMHDLF